MWEDPHERLTIKVLRISFSDTQTFGDLLHVGSSYENEFRTMFTSDRQFDLSMAWKKRTQLWLFYHKHHEPWSAWSCVENAKGKHVFSRKVRWLNALRFLAQLYFKTSWNKSRMLPSFRQTKQSLESHLLSNLSSAKTSMSLMMNLSSGSGMFWKF